MTDESGSAGIGIIGHAWLGQTIHDIQHEQDEDVDGPPSRAMTDESGSAGFGIIGHAWLGQTIHDIQHEQDEDVDGPPSRAMTEWVIVEALCRKTTQAAH